MLRRVACFFLILIATAAAAVASELPVIPRPTHVKVGRGVFRSGPDLKVNADPATLAAVKRAVEADGGPRVASSPRNRARVHLAIEIDLADQLGEEGYQLSVTRGAIEARAATEAGLFYAVQTLRQLSWAGGGSGEWVVPCCEVRDKPRFAWRGFMLDESRNFSGPDAVKRLLDAMALLKLNRFHWHLTDDTAWRIEIRQFPRLTEVGAVTPPTLADLVVRPKFYTRAQVRDIVAYARDRGILVIPEINMPGHADASNRAYPEHSGGGSRTRPAFTLNPASEATFQYLNTILREVAGMFPDAGMLHLGGDEVSEGWQKWPELPEVKDLMAREGIKDLTGVEAYFKRRMAFFVDSLGMKAGFWMGGAEQSLPPELATLFWWRHTAHKELRAALDGGYPVVLCPRLPCYFDFGQDSSHMAGARWLGRLFFNTLPSVYAFPDSLPSSLSGHAGVLGIQANLWTETAFTQERRDFLTFPRLLALAEAAWTPAARKDYAAFEERLRVHLPRLREAGIAPWDPFEKTPEATRTGQ